MSKLKFVHSKSKNALDIYYNEAIVVYIDNEYEEKTNSYLFWLEGLRDCNLIDELLCFSGKKLIQLADDSGKKNCTFYIGEPKFLLNFPHRNRHYITDEIFKSGSVSIYLTNQICRIELSNYYPDQIIENWNLKWSITKCLNILESSLNESDIEFESDFRNGKKEQLVNLKTEISNDIPIIESIKSFYQEVSKIGNKIELKLKNDVWLSKYEVDENYFCTNFLKPLLISLNFHDINYNHGTKEYGKDFTFSDTSKFQVTVNYGLQAKAGDVNGKVNSDIDELIGQIEDAFCMPYYSLGSKNERYITVFIIAISGKFTNNAKEKIMHKVNNRFGKIMGSIVFLDKEKLLELHNKRK